MHAYAHAQAKRGRRRLWATRTPTALADAPPDHYSHSAVGATADGFVSRGEIPISRPRSDLEPVRFISGREMDERCPGGPALYAAGAVGAASLRAAAELLPVALAVGGPDERPDERADSDAGAPADALEVALGIFSLGAATAVAGLPPGVTREMVVSGGRCTALLALDAALATTRAPLAAFRVSALPAPPPLVRSSLLACSALLAAAIIFCAACCSSFGVALCVSALVGLGRYSAGHAPPMPRISRVSRSE